MNWSRLLAGFWIGAVIITAVQATLSPHNSNTFEIFRTGWENISAGRNLYGVNAQHHDFFDYSPTFALIFAPFAIVPLGVGVLLWNAVNAGTLYWGLGRVLAPEQAFAARAIVFVDTVGSMQSAQSNAFCAGLIILVFAELDRRRESRAALATMAGAVIKVFPIAAVAFALFWRERLPRFAVWCLAIASVFVLAPLVFLSPAELVEQYRAWFSLQARITSREYSVMDQLYIWFGVHWPYWPIQVLGVLVLLAPFSRQAFRREAGSRSRIRLLFVASLLMFCVLFNHMAESPSFVIALAGVAIWFAVSARDRFAWTVLALVFAGTVLASSAVMPQVLQEEFFEPYRFKTLPILGVWIVIQTELWRLGPPRSERGEQHTQLQDSVA